MRRHRVQSSVIASVAYDDATRVLEVKFRSGRLYSYFEVPPHVVAELLTADSAGRYFNEQIRPNYRMARAGAVKRGMVPARGRRR